MPKIFLIKNKKIIARFKEARDFRYRNKSLNRLELYEGSGDTKALKDYTLYGTVQVQINNTIFEYLANYISYYPVMDRISLVKLHVLSTKPYIKLGPLTLRRRIS